MGNFEQHWYREYPSNGQEYEFVMNIHEHKANDLELIDNCMRIHAIILEQATHRFHLPDQWFKLNYILLENEKSIAMDAFLAYNEHKHNANKSCQVSKYKSQHERNC